MANECPKLTVKEHALITDMEGSYTGARQYRVRAITFAQKERQLVDCWCEKAKEIGVKKCKIYVVRPEVYQAQVTGEDAVMLAGKHLESGGILTEHHKREAQNLFEYKIILRRRRKS